MNASLAVWKDILNRLYGCSLTPGDPAFEEKCRAAAEKAARSFQKAESLETDGIIGTETWGRMFH